MATSAENVIITAEEREQRVEQVSTLIGQASRAVIETDQHMEKGADLVRILKAHKKKLDIKRRSFTDPLKLTAANIKAEFDESTDLIDAAVVKVTKLMTDYMREKERVADIERKRLIKVAEDKAQAEAEETQRLAAEAAQRVKDEADRTAANAEAEGDTETALAVTQAAEAKATEIVQQGNQAAEGVIDTAAHASSIAEHTGAGIKHHGDYGATVHSRKTRKWRIQDVRDIPVKYLQLDEAAIKEALREKKRQIDDQAFTKKLKGKELEAFIAEEMEKFEIPGLEFYFETGVSVR